MTLLELVYALRLRLDDEGGDTGTVPVGYTYYWEYSDAGCLFKNLELVRYLNSACRELSLRSPIRDSGVNELTQIRLKAGTSRYALDPRILAIDAVLLRSTATPLLKLSDAKEQNYWIDHETSLRDPQTVCQYREDFDSYTLTVYAAPTAVDTLDLAIRRYPLEDLDWAERTSQEPEFPAPFHDALIEWATMQCYLKNDADTFNKDLAGYHQGQFTDRVGPRINFQLQRIAKDVAGVRLRTRTYY